MSPSPFPGALSTWLTPPTTFTPFPRAVSASGLGSQIRTHVERRYGATWGQPVEHMREVVAATKAILDGWQGGGTIEFRGEYTTHTLMTPIFDPGPSPFGVPKVLVGALGPRMSRMAAEVADGVLVMPFNTERHMRERTTPAIESGLKAAGRSREDIEMVAEVIVATGRNEEELTASDAARFIVAFYGSTPAYRPVLEVEGWGELQPELNALSKQGEWQTHGLSGRRRRLRSDRGARVAPGGGSGDRPPVPRLRPDLRVLSRVFALGRACGGVHRGREGHRE